MDSAHSEDIQKHVRKYVVVFVALLALTLVTVAVSYLDLSKTGAIVVALIIATVKGSLVATYFMHLISEKRMIYMSLILTAVFFAVLMGLPLFHHADPIIYK